MSRGYIALEFGKKKSSEFAEAVVFSVLQAYFETLYVLLSLKYDEFIHSRHCASPLTNLFPFA